MSWSTSELRVRLAPLNWFKPSSKIFNWPFQGGTSFVDLICFVLSCVCYVFVRVCLYVLCCHLLGKGWPLGSHLWCLTVSLSLSHWYPGSGVVLDCIDSWSLHSYLLCWLHILHCWKSRFATQILVQQSDRWLLNNVDLGRINTNEVVLLEQFQWFCGFFDLLHVTSMVKNAKSSLCNCKV